MMLWWVEENDLQMLLAFGFKVLRALTKKGNPITIKLNKFIGQKATFWLPN